MSLSTEPPSQIPDPEVIPYFPPPRRPGRTAASIIVVVLLLAAAAVCGGWWYMVTRLESDIMTFAAKLESQGGHFTAATRTREGFPFRPTVALTDPSIAFPPGAPGPWSWSGERATVGVSLFQPTTIDVALSGAGHLQVTPLGQPLDLDIQADRATVQLARDSVRETASVTLANVSVADTNGDVSQIDSLTIDRTRANTAPADEHGEAYGVALQLAGFALPTSHATPLGRTLSQLVFEAHVLGPLPPALDEDALTRWRDAGGTIAVPRLIGQFGPLVMSAEATLAFDKEMQPLGAGTGRIQGFAPALDALAASQVIRLNDANTAKAFLSMLARPPTPGAPPQLTAPLTIQEGKLFVGPVAVMTMPRLQWPSQKAAPVDLPPEDAPTSNAPSDDDPVTAAPPPKVEMPEGR